MTEDGSGEQLRATPLQHIKFDDLRDFIDQQSRIASDIHERLKEITVYKTLNNQASKGLLITLPLFLMTCV